MKWTNKGHELDSAGEQLCRLFHDKEKKLYIFGAGRIGREVKAVFVKTGCFAGFLDNDENKQRTGVDGAEVLSLQTYREEQRNGLLVIAADRKHIPAMENQLLGAGLKKNQDFYTATEFMERIFPILSVYEFGRLFVDIVQICLTERCGLKCKKCAHACYAVDKSRADMSLETAKESADCLFGKIDLMREFVLIGGEPFLYAGLPEIISYIGERYRDKMSVFSITTNGTILPCQAVLDACKRYDVLIRISNYSSAIERLEEQYKKLLKRLEESRIDYVLGDKEQRWVDYGFESVDWGWQEAELLKTFERCKTPCREIRGSRYYYCVMARSVSENLRMNLGDKDYLDLARLEGDGKKLLMEFQMGYSERGYLAMCNHCRGADAVRYPIPAAEQISCRQYSRNAWKRREVR